MKSALKGLFKTKKADKEEAEAPAAPAAPPPPPAVAATLPQPVQLPAAHSAAPQARDASAATGEAAPLTIAQELAKMDLSGKMDQKLQFAHLNTKVVGFIEKSLHPSMTPGQVTNICACLAEAKELFAKNMGKRVRDTYRVGKLLGAGAFAKVFAGSHRLSGDAVAIKVISKTDTYDHRQRPDIIREVAIMMLLKHHPHTTSVYDAFEDGTSFVLVLELCKGGELFDAIIKRHHLTEKDAAEIMSSIISVVRECHALGIVHRDLKPENVLLKEDKESSMKVKVIDFGTSNLCGASEILHSKFGTPYYVAPEVLQSKYSHAADVWSCGVIMYILLCGYPPFGGRTDDAILHKIVAGNYTFAGREWASVSQDAKDMITLMLEMDVAKRQTAEQLLNHPWIRNQAAVASGASNPMGNLMMQRLRQFGGMQRMKRLALACLVRTLNNRDVKRLLELFESSDPDKTGKLDRDTFHAALERVGATIKFDELESLLELDPAADADDMIDYNDFVAAMLDTERVAKKREAMRRSFEALDQDGDGMISAEDIVKASKGRFSVEVAREMVEETLGPDATPHDGEDVQVDFAAFEKMMQS